VLFRSQVNKTLLDLVLVNEADKAAQKLSGGQKRKLCLAIALMNSPKVICSFTILYCTQIVTVKLH